VVREQLVAWAGDCMVRGSVELGEGRLSDQVNELDVVTFFDVTLRALDDGHEVTVDELEVERGELHVIEVHGRRGDPDRRLRTVEERVTVELGPFEVTGNLHRPPNTQSMAALSRWAHFVPMTDALVGLRDREDDRVAQPVVLVNRQRIGKTRALPVMPVLADEQPPAPPA
jgi:hypothetical protein